MRRDLRRTLSIVVTAMVVLASCVRERDTRRPSFVLIVLDTTRVDAVSSYGAIAGTTPAIDALAREGLRFRRAYAQAPWTLPSHATLLTGLLPGQHGLSARNSRAPDSIVTLAERLQQAGYQTFGVSENPWISPEFNLTQGFDEFVAVKSRGQVLMTGDLKSGGESIEALAQWWRSRATDRPYFVFANLMDPHLPYPIRESNSFLPADADRDDAAAVSQFEGDYLCNPAPSARDLQILRAMYLREVHSVDAKVDQILRVLESDDEGSRVTIVTADHGEHLGGHQLLGHAFSVRNALLHVPLIVHGARVPEPAVIEEPVALADITPTILAWAGLELPRELSGRSLPTEAGEYTDSRSLVAEYHDPIDGPVEGLPALERRLLQVALEVRKACEGKANPVFGQMRSLIQYPYKLNWYAEYEAELYDIESDPMERHDLARLHPEIVARMSEELRRHPAAPPTDAILPGNQNRRPELSPESVRRLEALGYLRGEH